MSPEQIAGAATRTLRFGAGVADDVATVEIDDTSAATTTSSVARMTTGYPLLAAAKRANRGRRLPAPIATRASCWAYPK